MIHWANFHLSSITIYNLLYVKFILFSIKISLDLINLKLQQ